MGRFNLEEYETVETRLEKFWTDHENGRVLTTMEYQDERRFIVRAEIYFDRDDARPVATGYAEEIVGVGMVNSTSALENCETSAIGRALANCNYASKGKRPSREEMQKVERYEAEPRRSPASAPSEAELEIAQSYIDQVGIIDSEEELKAFYNAETTLPYRDMLVGKRTLKSAVTDRLGVLRGQKE